MFQTLASPITRLARLAAPVVLVAGALTAAQPASATDWCVDTACGGTPIASFEGALLAAAQSPDSDRIFLGAKTYSAKSAGGFHYNGAGSVEIIGAGEGQTILTGPSPMSGVMAFNGGPGSGMRDLSIELGQMGAGTYGVTLSGATATRIAVAEAPSQTNPHFGVALYGGATLGDSSVTLGNAPDTIGVLFVTPGGTLRDSTVSADWAVLSEVGGTVERSWLTGGAYALRAHGGANVIRNSVLKVNDATGNGIAVIPVNGTSPTVNADGLTMTTGFGGGNDAIYGSASLAGQVSAIDVRNSVIRGYTNVFAGASSGAGTVNLAGSWSDYDKNRVQTIGSNVSVSHTHISNSTSPGFVNAASGNYRLASGSPLIDAGDPSAPQGRDIDGNPSVTDGDHDGVARRDIGAFEADGPLPVDPLTPVGETAPAGGTTTGSAPMPPISGSPDTQPPVISRLGFTNKKFAVGRAHTAIAALARGTKLRYTLSEPAKVTVVIQKIGARRAAGKLSRRGAAGANAVKFSGRIGSRALAPGRYRALVTATDDAGNRSRVAHASFRIVRG